MSGVRNLRAMFEQKNDQQTSPPENRGRSPGPGSGLASFGSPTPSQSPRPLSKVRTNFVAVEKDGRIGLRRDPSASDSVSVTSRRLSNETENTTPAALPDKHDVFAENMAKTSVAFKTNLANDPIPESPRQISPAKFSPKKGAQTPDITPGPNPDKIVDEEETRTKLTPADPTSKAAVNGKGPVSAGLNGASTARDKVNKNKATGSRLTPKAAPISISTKTTSKPIKSPSVAKAPKSPAKDTAKATVSHPEKKAAVSKSSITPGKKPGALDLTPSSTGFVKPKVKSPTRPVKLPASLTAPTASSASKLGVAGAPPRQSLSRASGNLGVPASHRPISRASATNAGTTATKSLRRQSSTINRPRPSIGPPPKMPARDHPIVRRESQVDDGFLARMMRPTQASSGKTSDKAPVTPPRKTSVPSAQASARKAAAKVAESGKPTKDSSIAKNAVTTKDTAQEEAVAKKVVKEAAVAPAEPTAKEVAPVAAQTETAEAAIEAAAVSNDTAVTPVVERSKAEAEAEAKSSKVDETIVAREPETIEGMPSTPVEEVELTNGHSDVTSDEQDIPVIIEPYKQDIPAVIESEKQDVPEIIELDKQDTPTIISSANPKKVEDVEDVGQAQKQAAPEMPHEKVEPVASLEKSTDGVADQQPSTSSDEEAVKIEEVKTESA
ncbi:hypothetical protein BJ170DRAFT_688165 [Xylariales sp. AK1849]|nr:hypothetical protein BJ170DRAFT_688165 [Xylariales sp. AK1849]